MARGMPSMVALLGMLAVAGYQHRDKLGSMLGGNNANNGMGGQNQGGLGGMLGGGQGGGLGGMLGGALGGAGGGMAGGGLGSVLSGGLGDLMDRFNGSGHGSKAQSWVGTGQNEPIHPSDLEQSLGADTIAELQEKTGLDRQELLERLSKTLPDAVNHFTPDGRLPTEQEANRFM